MLFVFVFNEFSLMKLIKMLLIKIIFAGASMRACVCSVVGLRKEEEAEVVLRSQVLSSV